MKRIIGDDMARFFSRISRKRGCWLWKGSIRGKGYGQFWLTDKQTYAHRAAYELFKGKIPAKFDIDHLCKNTLCVNPDHLEAVPHRENITRGNGVVNKISGLPVGVRKTEYGKYRVSKRLQGKTVNIGSFNGLEEAVEAYRMAGV